MRSSAESKGFDRGLTQGRREMESEAAERERKAQARYDEAEKRIRDAEQKRAAADELIENAAREAEAAKKAALVEAKDEIYKLRQEAEKEIRDRRTEIGKQERRLHQKEEALDKKTDSIEKKEEALQAKLQEADTIREEAEAVKNKQIEELERISGLTREQAKEYILQALDDDLTHEKAVKVSAYEQQVKEECEEKARSYISLSIAKCAADQVSEAAVSVVALPSDEMKGRIIGREGRNIRTLETLTGVDLIIDDTPEAITLSCFDQVRREIARIALERLIADGRIHPSRIEEMVEKAKREVEHKIKQEGERAVLETNVHGINHELVKLLGRLKFRTSYSQNVLTHSIEVAQLSGVLAAELGVDVNLAKRAGLLHDIGKALTSEVEGSHVQIGVDVCRKAHENPEVIHAIEAHHNDVEPRTAIACIVQAADAISAARPGARSENYEN
ncbi:MAG: ribonuclease Y, partial [Oscillospiraceae bacterium]|nr:ribonuclease Y [Oscillospiraceae bacterium]